MLSPCPASDFYKILPCILPFGPACGSSNFVPDKFVFSEKYPKEPSPDALAPKLFGSARFVRCGLRAARIRIPSSAGLKITSL